MPIFNKTIISAVGRGGANFPGDVIVIKYLLNTVPEADGGPPFVILQSAAIAELIEAITRFQKKAIGASDGRVDIEGRTIAALREFDPTPEDPPFVPTTTSGKKGLLKKRQDRVPKPPKRILGSVGRNANNFPDDIDTIKFLLNTVPVSAGGPSSLILKRTTLDELIPKIETFQSRQLGFADGRVDVGGRTFARLQSFDPSPDFPAFVPDAPSPGKKGSGKGGGGKS